MTYETLVHEHVQSNSLTLHPGKGSYRTTGGILFLYGSSLPNQVLLLHPDVFGFLFQFVLSLVTPCSFLTKPDLDFLHTNS